MNKQLTLCSYISQGSGVGRFDFINKILTRADNVLIQEHWSADNQFNLFNKHLKDIQCHCVSAMSLWKVISGRPFGGCAIVWKNDL